MIHIIYHSTTTHLIVDRVEWAATTSCSPVPPAVIGPTTASSHTAQSVTFPMCWTQSRRAKSATASRCRRVHFAATKSLKAVNNVTAATMIKSAMIRAAIHASSVIMIWVWMPLPRAVRVVLVLSAVQVRVRAAITRPAHLCRPVIVSNAKRRLNVRGVPTAMVPRQNVPSQNRVMIRLNATMVSNRLAYVHLSCSN